jgi:hypothetical protein
MMKLLIALLALPIILKMSLGLKCNRKAHLHCKVQLRCKNSFYLDKTQISLLCLDDPYLLITKRIFKFIILFLQKI